MQKLSNFHVIFALCALTFKLLSIMENWKVTDCMVILQLCGAANENRSMKGY